MVMSSSRFLAPGRAAAAAAASSSSSSDSSASPVSAPSVIAAARRISLARRRCAATFAALRRTSASPRCLRSNFRVLFFCLGPIVDDRSTGTERVAPARARDVCEGTADGRRRRLGHHERRFFFKGARGIRRQLSIDDEVHRGLKK